jgi:hypothetical protein
MSVTLADGSVLSIATAYATTKTMSAITNATDAVATLEASHGVVVSDVVEITSAWGGIDGRIARASVVDTNDVTLEGIDTSDTTLYPTAGGAGSVREISTWAQVTQILSIADEGGEQQYFDYQFMDQLFQRRIPTVTSPTTINLEIANDASLAYLATVRAAQASQTVRAARLVFRNGQRIYFNAFWSLGFMPKLALNQGVRRAISLAITALPTEYTS